MRPYKINITHPETVVFINGFRILSLKGFFWFFINLLAIIRSVKSHKGCFESFPCLVSPLCFVMITYWHNESEMQDYFQSKGHVRLMKFLRANPKSLGLFNEKYHPEVSGTYINSQMGLAKLFARA